MRAKNKIVLRKNACKSLLDYYFIYTYIYIFNYKRNCLFLCCDRVYIGDCCNCNTLYLYIYIGKSIENKKRKKKKGRVLLVMFLKRGVPFSH